MVKKTYTIQEIELAIKSVADMNGFEWNYWVVPFVKQFLLKIK